MDADEVATLIEERVAEARAKVRTPRDADDDAHFAAVVVSPQFEDMPVVDQHQVVHDALEEYITDEIHAIELTTLTPDQVE
jgi:acid stress-induced BolA-like protein IbaG/YrbA